MSNAFREMIQQKAANSQGKSQGAYAPAIQEKLDDLTTIRLREMDENGIDMQVLSQVALGNQFTAAEEQSLALNTNDQIARTIAEHPDRFAGFATLPMSDPLAAANELERAVRSLGLQGAMINGTSQGRFLDDPIFFPILERAVALDVPIYIHPGVPPAAVQGAYYNGFEPQLSFLLGTAGWGWHSEIGIHVLRMILAGVFDRLPNLHIIIGHMGEMIPFMLARSNQVLTPQAKHLQRSISDYILENVYITTSGFFTDPPLALALEIMGVDRILFAIDYPFSSNAQGRAFLESSKVLSATDKEEICHLNAERLLKLS